MDSGEFIKSKARVVAPVVALLISLGTGVNAFHIHEDIERARANQQNTNTEQKNFDVSVGFGGGLGVLSIYGIYAYIREPNHEIVDDSEKPDVD